MKQIIEHGYRRYETRCKNCGCLFYYELDDIANGQVECPECGDKCIHSLTLNKDLTSQIKGQDDEQM